MKLFFVAILSTFMFLTSCRQSIEYDNIHNKDGLYFNKVTTELLDGKYISVSPNPNGASESVITTEFKDGVPVGEWEEKYGSSTIHSGYYITDNTLTTKIREITDSKRVDLNLWEESGYTTLTLELMKPTYTDSSALEDAIEISMENLKSKFHFNTINIDSISNSTKKKLYGVDIK